MKTFQLTSLLHNGIPLAQILTFYKAQLELSTTEEVFSIERKRLYKKRAKTFANYYYQLQQSVLELI